MIDRLILPFQKRILAPPAAALAQIGVSANAVTLTGFAIGLAAVPAIADGHTLLGLGAILANRVLDGLDGAVARIAGPTARGAFLDIALDFFFYACVPLAFALADPAANALSACALVVAFVGTGSSFLAFAAIAAHDPQGAQEPDKGIRYLGGLTEGAETIAFFVAICIWPAQFAILAWIYAAACALTTLSRWVAGWRTFR
ncbi:MAG: CDP-alcohol phosphatidyltransferase family protein [Alphaproteobacteria bacterium]|nr:CDP-alcohol phosphatidyltransferase family protein [Alphaproteobacteria bacterium]